MKLKQKEQFPWEDNELVNKRELRDKYFYESRKTSLPEDFEPYKLYRSEYQTLNPRKMKEYFAENTMKDFKNSKKFWDFYKSSIKIKSD